MNKLNTAWQAASEEMYKATQANAQPGQQPGPDASAEQPKNDDEVTDVDFEEVNDNKK